MLSETLTEKLVKILITEADRTAKSAGLDVTLNATGMKLAWEKATALQFRQLALNARVPWREKYFLMIQITKAPCYVKLRERFMAVLEERIGAERERRMREAS